MDKNIVFFDIDPNSANVSQLIFSNVRQFTDGLNAIAVFLHSWIAGLWSFFGSQEIESAKKFGQVLSQVPAVKLIDSSSIFDADDNNHDIDFNRSIWQLVPYHILSEVPVRGENVYESKRDGEQTEEDIRDGEVRNENIPRCHHLLDIIIVNVFWKNYH